MRQYVEPFIQGQIAKKRAEEDMLYYASRKKAMVIFCSMTTI